MPPPDRTYAASAPEHQEKGLHPLHGMRFLAADTGSRITYFEVSLRADSMLALASGTRHDT